MMIIIYAFLLLGIESLLLILFMLLASTFDKNFTLSSVLIESFSTVLFLIPYRIMYLNTPFVIGSLYLVNRITDSNMMTWKFGFINTGCFLLAFFIYALSHSNSWQLIDLSVPFFRNIILMLTIATFISPAIFSFVKNHIWTL